MVEEGPEGTEPTSYAVEVHESSHEATEAAEAADEQGRGEPHSATEGIRRAHGDPGDVGCSVGRKKGGWLWITKTPRDSTVIQTSPEKRGKPWQDTAWR